MVTVPASQVPQECRLPLGDWQPVPLPLRGGLALPVLLLEQPLWERRREAGPGSGEQLPQAPHELLCGGGLTGGTAVP